MSFDAVILAGGRSSRMGVDKARLRVGAETLLERQVHIAREAGAAQLFVSCRSKEDYPLPGVVPLPDQQKDGGPMEGIANALEATRAERLLVLAVDLPALSLDYVNWLLGHESPGVIPMLRGGPEPLAALYPSAAASLARAALAVERRSARAFAEAVCRSAGGIAVSVPSVLAHELLNWNRPEEWTGGLDLGGTHRL